MDIHFQSINEELAKGIKIDKMPLELGEEVERINNFLIKGIGQKPSWLDGFFESNKCKLVETICRAISRVDGISSLRGYSEGYFNEIIQNANDLHYGDTIEIHVEKVGAICKLTCSYLDKGFELSNIYGFLNREMSDKASENGQTGKFGVGIKSFFKFINRMEIISNVNFKFSVQREPSDMRVYGDVSLNEHWNKRCTELSFEYDSNQIVEFNTVKLTNLVDYLCRNSIPDVNKFFVSGEDDELIFDLRSLMFMQLKDGKSKKSISRLVFSGSRHKVEICCENIDGPHYVKNDENSWEIRDLNLVIKIEDQTHYEREYIVFWNDNMAFGFPVNNLLEEKNRVYSTYYLKTDHQEQIRPLAMLVNTKYSNIHRNDVGDSEDGIRQVYQMIRDKMLHLYSCMCSKDTGNSKCRDKVSDVFHSILVRYIYADRAKYYESPLNCFDIDNRYLPKRRLEDKRYIVVHDLKEKYETATYLEGDIIKELKETYLDYVERKNVFNYSEMVNAGDCIYGVKRLYKLIHTKYGQELECSKTNIPEIARIINYFDGVRAYLSYVISDERTEDGNVTDAEIDRWLIGLESECGKYFNPNMFLKMVGRYGINSAIDFDGTVRCGNLSFKDYLFNGIFEEKKGILADYQNKQFDETYSELKKELLEKRYRDTGNKRDNYAIRCIHPSGRSINGWDGTLDYYECSGYQISYDDLKQPELFLEKLALDTSFKGMIHNRSLRLFEKKARGMWRRDYEFKSSYILEQQIIDLSCLKNIKLLGFSDFIASIKYRKLLDEELAEQIHLSCNQSEISTQRIADYLLPLMIEAQEGEKSAYLLDEFDPNDVEIVNVIENTNNEAQELNRAFIEKITGYKIHLYRFESNTRRKIISFFGGGRLAIRTESGKSFRKVANYSSREKDIYVFYDNFGNDAHDTISYVLDEIGIPKKTLELLQGYIHNGNSTKTMNYLSRRRSLAKVKKKLILDWCNIENDEVSLVYDNEILYRLLTARGSYDIFCPICAEIPIEIFDYGEDTKHKHSRKIVVLENENPDTKEAVPYIVTVACAYCVEKLKNTLSKSEFDGKNLTLITQIAHGQHEKMKSRKQIELSPINIELMKKFKM